MALAGSQVCLLGSQGFASGSVADFRDALDMSGRMALASSQGVLLCDNNLEADGCENVFAVDREMGCGPGEFVRRPIPYVPR